MTVWPARPAHPAERSVAASIHVKADARRVFQALTLPEYLEAWICVPDRTPESAIAVVGEANGFRLIHAAEGRVVTSIAARFLSQRLRALRLYWRRTRARASAWGLVDLQIREQCDGCMVGLLHSALASAEEYLWHQKLWQCSLEKLASLLRVD